MSMLHVSRSTQPKVNKTSSLMNEEVMFDKNIVQCIYNLIQKFRFNKTLTPEMVHQQLELVFDINVIQDQFEKLSESVLGQCVQQVHVETEANSLKSVACKYVYGSRVAANRVKPGTSVPTVGFHTLENKIKMHEPLQIQSKVSKQLIQYLSGIYDELLKAGDISSIKNTNVVKQNSIANYYEHLDYQNELKNSGMHAGLCYRLIEEMWDRSPPIYSLPPTIKDYTGQSQASLLSWLLGTASKFIFALNKYGNVNKEASILAEVANCWKINTDNSLSPRNSETNIEVLNENIPISGIVVLTENLKIQLQDHIFARTTKLRNEIIVCDVEPKDFHPQKAFITNGKIRMESTNLFVKDEKQAKVDDEIKKVEFLKMGSEIFAIHVRDPAYYQSESSATDRFKEVVKVDFMMPLSVNFKGNSSDDIFKRDDSTPYVLPTKIFFKDAKGVTRQIRVKEMIPFVTGMMRELNQFKDSINGAAQRLSKLFKLSQISKGRETEIINEQKLRAYRHLDETFPMHYHLDLKKTPITVANIDKIFSEICQKPLWIMISNISYESILTNIIALWNDFAYTQSIHDQRGLGKYSLFSTDSPVIKHAEHFIKKHNSTLYPWIANKGYQLKSLLVEKLRYPTEIEDYVEFIIYLVNNEQMYKNIFANGNYHLGLGFILNRTETFESESMLLSRCQGYKLFYSETSTEAKNDCQSPDFKLITSMQTGHMPSSLGHPCIKYPHCLLSEHGNMGSEIINSDFMFDKRKPLPRYDEQVWIPIFCNVEMEEAMFEDTYNPYGRSNIAFERDSLDYLTPDLVNDPLSGLPGFNPMCLGMFNMNFVFHSRLLVSPTGFAMKKHIIPNCHANFWFNEFKKNASCCKNKMIMQNLNENAVSASEMNLHYNDLSEVMGGSTCKFCYSNPKMVKTLMTERDNRTIPGRNVYRQQNDFLLSGSKLMENLDRGVNANDRCLLRC